MNRLALIVPSLIGSLCLSALPAAAGELSVPPVFGNHCVLQRDQKLPVWGKASPGEKVTVSIAKHSASAQAKSDGKWRVTLPALSAGGPYTLTVQGKDKTLAFDDVLIGDVWVCSGQSNMEWPLQLAQNGEKEVAEAQHPRLRLYTVPKLVADTPQDTCGGDWAVCTPESARNFSAVGYFFGRYLQEQLDVPVGLINTSWGGTPAESWTSEPVLKANQKLADITKNWEKIVEDYPKAKAAYDVQVKAWESQRDQAKATGAAEPPAPPVPMGPGHSWQPSGLYNGMLHPLMPFGIRGAIWYQGESNADRAYQYRVLFPTMIRDWRKNWGQGAFPFLFVQLANFMEPLQKPQTASYWAELREAQSMTLQLENTGMAVAIDIGDAKDIHPRNKQDVGKRLALAGLKVAFGRNIPYSGPVYTSHTIKGNEVRLRFDHADGGLRAFNHTRVGLTPTADGRVTGFAIAGADKHFVWADARIDGDEVIVSSKDVAKPVAVRYAWADNPECNLFNGAELPASPFRTDDWGGISSENPELPPQFDLPANGILLGVNGPQVERSPGWFSNLGPSCFATMGYWAIQGGGEQTFRWKMEKVEPGRYEVFAWITDDPNRDHATDATYTVTARDGKKTVRISQGDCARSWKSLGIFVLDRRSFVELTNKATGNVIADAVCLVPVEEPKHSR